MADRVMDHSAYTVGWICALSLELTASRAMLDKPHSKLETQDDQDKNIYRLGQIAGHNVVIACLPASVYGNQSAATVAKDMLRTFKSIKFGLMVGIGGGVPSEKRDIRLGDVVVSMPGKDHGGVINYDMGKLLPGGGFEKKAHLNKPPLGLLSALNDLKSTHDMEEPKIQEYILETLRKYGKMRTSYISPGPASDHLYKTECEHRVSTGKCSECTAPEEVKREPRAEDSGPSIHYGLIGSGSKIVASIKDRDALRDRDDILCFEMEAAGLMDSFPCIVIRGISDYADSYKRDEWQPFAALAAAAYAKELLQVIPCHHVDKMQNAGAVAGLSILGIRLQQKLELDKAYNNLRMSGSPETLFLDMPVLRGRVFDASTADVSLVPTKSFGSCAFELANLLQLLPGQSRFNLLELETVSLQELYHDSETYYCKCSREGLFRFITQHFVKIRESSGRLLIQTDIGYFTLTPTERRLIVRLNARERSMGVVAPTNQDYAALIKCAAGFWLIRHGDEVSWTENSSLIPDDGREWAGPFDVSTLLLRQDIEHRNCLYFLDEKVYHEIQINKEYAQKIGEALKWVNERKTQDFIRTQESFKLFDLLSQKQIISRDALNIVTRASRLILSDAISRKHDSTSIGNDPAEGRQLSGDDKTAFVFSCSRLYDALADEYKANPSSINLQTRLISAVEDDPNVVTGLLALALIRKGNAQFILYKAISSPRLWLDLLVTTDDDIYVG